MTPPEKSLNVEHMFATPLIRARHPDLTGLIAPLKSVILHQKETNKGMTRSNMGGWHSRPNMDRWGGPAAQALVQFAIGLTETHLVIKPAPPDLVTGWGVDMWANVNSAGQGNAHHCHPGAFASAVFYVDQGNSGVPARDGHIVMEDPRFPMAYMQHPNVFWPGADGEATESQCAVLPEAGEMIIFPSWLGHSVNPHTGSGDRISIAINLTLLWQPEEAGS